MRSVINSGEAEVRKCIHHGCRHFISLGFYFNTYQNMYTSQKVQQPAVMSITYAAKSINGAPWPGSATGARGVGNIGHVTQCSRSVWINKHLIRLFWSNNFDSYHTIGIVSDL